MLPGPLLPVVNDPALQASALKRQLGRPVYQGGAGLLQEDFLLAVLKRLSAQSGSVPVSELLAQVAPQAGEAPVQTQKLQRQLGWLVKAGLASPVHAKAERDNPVGARSEETNRV